MVGGAGAHVPLAGLLALQLIVEGIRGLLGGEVDVASAAAAAAEAGGCLGQAVLEVRGGTGGRAWVGGLGGLEGVAGAAAAGVDVVAGCGVGFGDGVGGHWGGE